MILYSVENTSNNISASTITSAPQKRSHQGHKAKGSSHRSQASGGSKGAVTSQIATSSARSKFGWTLVDFHIAMKNLNMSSGTYREVVRLTTSAYNREVEKSCAMTRNNTPTNTVVSPSCTGDEATTSTSTVVVAAVPLPDYHNPPPPLQSQLSLQPPQQSSVSPSLPLAVQSTPTNAGTNWLTPVHSCSSSSSSPLFGTTTITTPVAETALKEEGQRRQCWQATTNSPVATFGDNVPNKRGKESCLFDLEQQKQHQQMWNKVLEGIEGNDTSCEKELQAEGCKQEEGQKAVTRLWLGEQPSSQQQQQQSWDCSTDDSPTDLDFGPSSSQPRGDSSKLLNNHSQTYFLNNTRCVFWPPAAADMHPCYNFATIASEAAVIQQENIFTRTTSQSTSPPSPPVVDQIHQNEEFLNDASIGNSPPMNSSQLLQFPQTTNNDLLLLPSSSCSTHYTITEQQQCLDLSQESINMNKQRDDHPVQQKSLTEGKGRERKRISYSEFFSSPLEEENEGDDAGCNPNNIQTPFSHSFCDRSNKKKRRHDSSGGPDAFSCSPGGTSSDSFSSPSPPACKRGVKPISPEQSADAATWKGEKQTRDLNSAKLWEICVHLLWHPHKYSQFITWVDKRKGIFQLRDSLLLAQYYNHYKLFIAQEGSTAGTSTQAGRGSSATTRWSSAANKLLSSSAKEGTDCSSSASSSSASVTVPLKSAERPLIKLGSITRAFRHYYKTGVINKVPNKYKYQFGVNATDWQLGVRRKKAQESLQKWEKCMEREKQMEEMDKIPPPTPSKQHKGGRSTGVEMDLDDEDDFFLFLDCHNSSSPPPPPSPMTSEESGVERQSGISQ